MVEYFRKAKVLIEIDTNKMRYVLDKEITDFNDIVPTVSEFQRGVEERAGE